VPHLFHLGMAVTWRGAIGPDRRVYLLMNVATYGVLLLAFAAGVLFPQLARAQHTRLVDDGTADLVGALVTRPWLFAVTILAVNVVRIGVLTIIGPSMIVPFLGVPLFAYWTITTGLTLAPDSDIGWVALIPHTVTVVIEFQAYSTASCRLPAGAAATRPAGVPRGDPARRRCALRSVLAALPRAPVDAMATVTARSSRRTVGAGARRDGPDTCAATPV
jgi:hypothetical protein